MRTDQQNKALHKGLDMIAIALNELGNGLHIVLNTKRDKFLKSLLEQIITITQKAIDYLESKDTIQIPWDKESVKKYLLHPIVRARFDVDSTTKLEKTEVSEAWDILIGRLLDAGYIENYIDFPSEDSQ